VEFNLQSFLFSLLFSSDAPLMVEDFQKVLQRHQAEEEQRPEEEEPLWTNVPSELTTVQLRDELDRMARDYVGQQSVYRLLQGPHGYQLVCAPAYAHWIRLARGAPKPLRLSPAALETLTIVAYRQPVTRAEIEAVRGVAADGALQRLREWGLIESTGRAEDLPGRPRLWGTTDRFLEYCGIRSLEELPAADSVSPAQLDEWIRQAAYPEKDAAPDNELLGLAPPDET
jgi:segregation and condensation protein B